MKKKDEEKKVNQETKKDPASGSSLNIDLPEIPLEVRKFIATTDITFGLGDLLSKARFPLGIKLPLVRKFETASIESRRQYYEKLEMQREEEEKRKKEERNKPKAEDILSAENEKKEREKKEREEKERERLEMEKAKYVPVYKSDPYPVRDFIWMIPAGKNAMFVLQEMKNSGYRYMTIDLGKKFSYL